MRISVGPGGISSGGDLFKGTLERPMPLGAGLASDQGRPLLFVVDPSAYGRRRATARRPGARSGGRSGIGQKPTAPVLDIAQLRAQALDPATCSPPDLD
jgi:hypothetical protein